MGETGKSDPTSKIIKTSNIDVTQDAGSALDTPDKTLIEETQSVGSVHGNKTLSSEDTSPINHPLLASTSLSDDHLRGVLNEAKAIYHPKTPPFVQKPRHSEPRQRAVFLTRNGQRPECPTRAHLIPHKWDDHWRYFWCLDLDDDRYIVKGYPNHGVLRGAKWYYLVWSPILKGFKEEPIAFSTNNNNPDNSHKGVRGNPLQVSAPTDAAIDTAAVTKAATAATDPHYYTDGNDSGDPSLSDGGFTADVSPVLERTPYRLRSDPLPGGWLHQAKDLEESSVGTHTSLRSAVPSFSPSDSSSSGSDSDVSLYQSHGGLNQQRVDSTPVNMPRIDDLVPTVSSATQYQVNSNQEPALKDAHISGSAIKRITPNETVGNPPAALLGPSKRRISASITHSKITDRNPSLKLTVQSWGGIVGKVDDNASTRGRLPSEEPTPALVSRLSPYQARPRRSHKPTLKKFDSIQPAAVTKKRKASGNTSKPVTKRHQHQTASTAMKRPRTDPYATPSYTPKLTIQSSPLSSVTLENDVSSTFLTDYKQNHTTLRASYNSSDNKTCPVMLKLRSCMTIETFFASIMSTTENTSRPDGVSTIMITFDWKDAKDLKKSICVKKNVGDSFEVFLEIIDEAPCWKKQGGKCEVAVEVVKP